MTTPRDSLYDHHYHRYDSDRARGPSIMQELPPVGSADVPRHAQFSHRDLIVRVDPLRADLNTEAARVAAALADKLRDVADRDDPVAARERDMLRRIGELEVEKRQLLDQVASAAKKIAEAKRLGVKACAFAALAAAAITDSGIDDDGASRAAMRGADMIRTALGAM